MFFGISWIGVGIWPQKPGQKRGSVQLKGGRFLSQGPRFPLRCHRFPLQALGSPNRGPFNCLIVGHSSLSYCIGLRGASESIGPGVSQKCPESVPVPECQKGHSGTLFGHSRARGLKGLGETLWDTPLDTPAFGDTCGDTLGNTLRSREPERPL